MYIFEKDINMYNDIPYIKNIPTIFEIPKNPLEFTLLPFFTIELQDLHVHKVLFFIKSNNVGCFQLKQTIHTNLFEALKLVFYTDRQKNKCY